MVEKATGRSAYKLMKRVDRAVALAMFERQVRKGPDARLNARVVNDHSRDPDAAQSLDRALIGKVRQTSKQII